MIATSAEPAGQFRRSPRRTTRESLSVYQRIGDKRGHRDGADEPGLLLCGPRQVRRGTEEHHRRAYAVSRPGRREPDQALCLNNLGSIRRYMDNFQDALTYYQQAYQIREKLKLTDDMAQSLQNLAEVNVDLGPVRHGGDAVSEGPGDCEKQRRPERRSRSIPAGWARCSPRKASMLRRSAPCRNR